MNRCSYCGGRLEPGTEIYYEEDNETYIAMQCEKCRRLTKVKRVGKRPAIDADKLFAQFGVPSISELGAKPGKPQVMECDRCHRKYGYTPMIYPSGEIEDESLPTGMHYPDHKTNQWKWACERCTNCPECGKYYKHQEDWGNNGHPAKVCDECRAERKALR